MKNKYFQNVYIGFIFLTVSIFYLKKIMKLYDGFIHLLKLNKP